MDQSDSKKKNQKQELLEDDDLEEGEEYEQFNQEQEQQIIQTILDLGNEIWHNFGEEGEIADVGIFFQHQFYVQCFQSAYEGIDFSNLLEDDIGGNSEKMAECIQALIDLLSQEILKFDMVHIKGSEIVDGNPEHVINLLQILQQISQQAGFAPEEDESANLSQRQQKDNKNSDQIDNKTQKRSNDNSGLQQNTSPGKQTSSRISQNNAEYKHQHNNKSEGSAFQAALEDEEDYEKQQFVDQLDDDEIGLEEDSQDNMNFNQDHFQQNDVARQNSNLRVDKVGDVIGQELDIEFDDEIQEKLQNQNLNRQLRGTRDQDEGNQRQNPNLQMLLNEDQKQQILDGEDNEYDDDGNEILQDHNDIELIENHEEYEQEQFEGQIDGNDDEEEYDDLNPHREVDEEVRNLNRQTNNMAEIVDDDDSQKNSQNLKNTDEDQYYEEDEDEEQEIDLEDLADIDPQFLKAAQENGLGLRDFLQQYKQMQEQQNQENFSEEQELADMLEGEERILRGGQNIEDEEYSDDVEKLEAEMSEKLQQMKQEDQKDEEEEEDEDALIDIENLNDQEKVMLWQYLHDEYQRDPDSLPMDRETVEQFLADNQELVQRVLGSNQQMDDEEEEAEEEQESQQDQRNTSNLKNSQRIQSNEIVVEANQSYSKNSQRENMQEHQYEDDDESQNLFKDEDDDHEGNQSAQYQQNIGQQIVFQQNTEPDVDIDDQQKEDQGDEELDEDEELQDQQEIFNPLYSHDKKDVEQVEVMNELIYQLDEQGNAVPIQIGNPGMIIIQNPNVNGGVPQMLDPTQLTSEQFQTLLDHQQMQYQQQVQQMQIMQQQQVAMPKIKKTIAGQKKVKKPTQYINSTIRRPPQPAGGIKMTVAAAVTKKMRRTTTAKLGMIQPNSNTISHDEKNWNPNARKLEMVGNRNNLLRQSGSQNSRRPQTAKYKKQQSIQGYKTVGQKNFNNFGSSVQKSNKNLQMIMMPQKSQIFTSFGNPTFNVQGTSTQRKNSSQHRKNNKKVASALYGSFRGSVKQEKLKKSASRPAKQVKQGDVQQQLANQFSQNQEIVMMGQGDLANGAFVEMPILSEEFLNELNEEQLQALLEQQQQLMILQQQNQGQDSNFSPPQNQIIQTTSKGSRGRAAKAIQQPMAARIPSKNQKGSGVRSNSAHRSSHESRKRVQKPRNSLNAASSGQLKMNPLNMPNGMTLPHQVVKSQKLAPYIYNQSESMLRGLVSHRKSSLNNGAQPNLQNQKQIRSAKRSQPNQAGKNLHKHLTKQNMLSPEMQQQQQLVDAYNMQQHLLAQQMQYGEGNMIQDDNDGMLGMQQDKKDQIQRGFNQGDDEVIHEVPQYEEEAESVTQSQFNQQNQHHTNTLSQNQGINQGMGRQKGPGMGMGQSNILPLQGGQISSIADDLSTEQIIELLQNNADAQAFSQNQQLDYVSPNAEQFDQNGDPIILNQGFLPEEVQIQLQQVLQERILNQQQMEQQQLFLQQQKQMHYEQQQNKIGSSQSRSYSSPGKSNQFPQAINEMAMDNRVQSYKNICNILTQSVSKAKEKYQHLQQNLEHSQKRQRQQSGKFSPPEGQSIQQTTTSIIPQQLESDLKIKKQKRQFEALLKQYKLEMKIQESKRQKDLKRAEKLALRDEKIQLIKQKKFEEDMMCKQKAQIMKRNDQQARLCKRVFKLASDLEKNKLLDEKRQLKETEFEKINQKEKMISTIENFYKDKINMLKERIDKEKFERKIAQEAQKKALAQMKKELDDQKRKEVQRYIQLLQQEDDKFDIQNLNLGKLEQQILNIYKHS